MQKEFIPVENLFRKNMADRILIVDPEMAICKLLAKRLTQEGYSCILATNGKEALDHLSQDDFFMMISDIHGPEMDGLGLIKKVKNLRPHARVVMMADYGRLDRVAEGLRFGADDFISKPIHLDFVSSIVQKASDKRHVDIVLEGYSQHLGKLLEERTAKLRKAYGMLKKAHLDTVRILIEAIDAKDPYTRGHSARVRKWSVEIGEKVGFSGKKLESLEFGALLHDIGMIGIKDEILHKQDRLSPEEFHHIQEHCLIGAKIVEGVSFFESEISVIRHHHERFDGTGYPDKLGAENIPLGARIIAVPDAFDAMTSLRPYRRAMPPEEAIAELKKEKGTHFDPHILEVFIQEKDFWDIKMGSWSRPAIV